MLREKQEILEKENSNDRVVTLPIIETYCKGIIKQHDTRT